MTTITSKVIADSVNSTGVRLTTVQLRYPRFIHAELMTHRVFSRNASSSRAVPTTRLLQDIEEDPAIPLHWGKNQKGMQADHETDTPVTIGRTTYTNRDAWLFGMESALIVARAFAHSGYHKQLVNRLVEPFSHINVLVTSTEWDNFFELRRHEDAEPHIHILADRIYESMVGSEPILRSGSWHLPYIDKKDRSKYSMEDALKISAARCASISYRTVDDLPMTPERAEAVHNKLVGSDPKHASPLEHQAFPMSWTGNSFYRNLRGWKQYRVYIEEGHEIEQGM